MVAGGTRPLRLEVSGDGRPFTGGTSGGSGSRAYSREVESYLRKAGWSPSRRTDSDGYQAAFAGEGLSLNRATRDFLARYGGLVISYPDAVGQTDVLEFCADDAVVGMGGGALDAMERELGVGRLCPIGHYQYAMCLLLQDEQGGVYGVSDDTTSFLGGSGEEAIENILSRREPRLIHSDVIEHEKRSQRRTREVRSSTRKPGT